MDTPEVVLSTELAVQLKLIARLTRKSQKAEKELKDAKAHLLSSCNHPDVEKKSDYIPGSYYDTAYTIYWSECKICGMKSENHTKNHGTYG